MPSAKNPVLMLDEIDKLGRDYRGDPAAALLEILDPEQNKTFRDNYLDLPLDLSKVLFITTANTLDTIPRPLLDRMEILRLSGYSEEEKVEIAKRYLLPRQLKEAGLTAEQASIPDETIRALIQRVTPGRPGCGAWNALIGRLTRKVALQFAEGKTEPVRVRPEDLADLLGPEPFTLDEMRKNAGRRGDGPRLDRNRRRRALHRSHPAARRQRRSDADRPTRRRDEGVGASRPELGVVARRLLGIDPSSVQGLRGPHPRPAGGDPEGRTLGRHHDGDGAGVGVLRRRRRDRHGHDGRDHPEGLVLPIGGVKEKVLAARRAGIKRVICRRPTRRTCASCPTRSATRWSSFSPSASKRCSRTRCRKLRNGWQCFTYNRDLRRIARPGLDRPGFFLFRQRRTICIARPCAEARRDVRASECNLSCLRSGIVPDRLSGRAQSWR